MTEYRIASYDSFFNNVGSYEHIGKYVDDNAAIKAASNMMSLLYQPSDLMEIQIYIKGLVMGEWCLIGAVHYEGDDNWSDTDIVFDACYC